MVWKVSIWPRNHLWGLYIRLERICTYHEMEEMLQKQHIFCLLGYQSCNFTYFFVAKTIYAIFLQFLVAITICTYLVRKVFAHSNLPSGKFRLFGPLAKRSKTFVIWSWSSSSVEEVDVTMPGGRKLWQYCCWGRGRHPSLLSWHPIKSRIRQLFSTSVPV